MDNLDIWRSAHLLLSLYGNEEAVVVAARRADALLHCGNHTGCSIWNAIGRAIGELNHHMPDEDEAMN